MWQVNTPRISARLLWAISEHINLEGLDPLLADDPDDPLNIIITNIHKVLFNVDTAAETTNRLQDVQAVLLCAQRLGSRHPRAGQLLTKELEEFRNNGLADSVNKHQCRLILQRIKYASNNSESRSVYSIGKYQLFWLCSSYNFRQFLGKVFLLLMSVFAEPPKKPPAPFLHLVELAFSPKLGLFCNNRIVTTTFLK